MDESEITLGDRYRDTITEFEGVATSRHEYLHGCTRVTLSAAGKDGAAPIHESFDAPQLEHVETAELVTSGRTGGDRPTPAPRVTG